MVKTFDSIKIKNMELRNRIVMAPMCMYASDDEGYVNNFHLVHYVTRSIGGVGLIILEATAVERRGRISGNDIGLWDETHINGLKQLNEEIKKYGAKVAVQLAHAGRKCGVATEPIIAPSNIRFDERYLEPKEMTKQDIKEVISSFKDAARRAHMADFDAIEIHGAHGYLINQFLSPLSNQRNDEYGGSIENRSRFLVEIIDEIRRVWPKEKPIMLRISASEYAEEGNHVSDLIEILNHIRNKGIDIIDVSSGGIVSAEINIYPGYQVKFAEQIKQNTNLVTMAGGLINNIDMIEEILQNKRADLVFLGRELLRNPYFVLNAAQHYNLDIEWPKPYKRGKK